MREESKTFTHESFHVPPMAQELTEEPANDDLPIAEEITEVPGFEQEMNSPDFIAYNSQRKINYCQELANSYQSELKKLATIFNDPETLDPNRKSVAKFKAEAIALRIMDLKRPLEIYQEIINLGDSDPTRTAQLYKEISDYHFPTDTRRSTNGLEVSILAKKADFKYQREILKGKENRNYRSTTTGKNPVKVYTPVLPHNPERLKILGILQDLHMEIGDLESELNKRVKTISERDPIEQLSEPMDSEIATAETLSATPIPAQLEKSRLNRQKSIAHLLQRLTDRFKKAA